MEAILDWLNSLYLWIKGLFDRVTEIADEVLPSINDMFEWLQDAYNFLIDEFFLGFPKWVFQQVCEGIIEFFNALPVPSFFLTAADAFSGLPSTVVFFLDALQVGPGVAMVLGAYLLRFIIRRIPLIG